MCCLGGEEGVQTVRYGRQLGANREPTIAG
jgi:hypothetical protein